MRTEEEIDAVVFVVACVIVVVLVVIGYITARCACALATRKTKPVNRLVDVVTSLNRLVFLRQVRLCSVLVFHSLLVDKPTSINIDPARGDSEMGFCKRSSLCMS